jgi:hypothetical protein
MMKMRNGWQVCVLSFAFLLVMLLGSAAVLKAEEEEVDHPKHPETDSFPVTSKQAKEGRPDATGVFKEPLEVGGFKIQFSGYAKVDVMYDFDPIGNEDQFKVNTIPVEGDPNSLLGSSSNVSARQTRLSVDVRNETPVGLVRGYVEGDFFGDGNSFRLRHGYGEWHGLLGGQTWTTFQDISARPFTLDYEGPDSAIFVRQAQVRYTDTPWEDIALAIAIEDPESEITVPTGVTGEGRSQMPDITAHGRFMKDWGHVQVSAIVRQLRYVSDGAVIDDSTLGHGLNFSGKLKVGKRDLVMGHFGFGSGIGRYIEAFGGTNSDAALNPAGEVKAIDAWGTVLGYTHFWSNLFSSTISGGYAGLDNEPSQPSDAIKSARSFHANLVYSPHRLISIGGEVMWGQRRDKNGAKGDATRLQFSVQYSFK